ncbi:MAG: hypothetical protein WCE57_08805 [Salegentibacter sp.]
MKKTSVLFLMVLFSVTVFAQRGKNWKGKSNEERASMYVDRMDNRLSLSDQQKEQIKEIQMTRMQAQQEMMVNNRQNMNNASDRAQARQEMQQNRMKMHEDFKAKMKGILNQDQYSKWEAMDKQQWERMQKMNDRPMRRNNNSNNTYQNDNDQDGR